MFKSDPQEFTDAVHRVFAATAPLEILQVFNDYGSLINNISSGKNVQHIFSNVQVNIAPASSFRGGELHQY